MLSKMFVREFDLALAALDKLINDGQFDSDSREHRIMVGTLITNREVNPLAAEEMLWRVKHFYKKSQRRKYGT